MSTAIVQKPADSLTPSPGNRPLGDLTWLKESIKMFGVLQPVGALPDGTLLFGNRRVACCRELGIDVPTRVFPNALGASEQVLIAAQENLQRANPTGYDQWQLYEHYRQLNPALTDRQIAERFAVSASTVVRWAAPSACVDSVVAALKECRLGISDCYAISKLPRGEQPDLLALKLKGATRDQLERAARGRRNPGGAAAKCNRIKLLLPSGITLVVAGAALDVDGLLESLGTATREARKAKDQGLNVKTLAAALKDRAATTTCPPA